VTLSSIVAVRGGVIVLSILSLSILSLILGHRSIELVAKAQGKQLKVLFESLAISFI